MRIFMYFLCMSCCVVITSQAMVAPDQETQSPSLGEQYQQLKHDYDKLKGELEQFDKFVNTWQEKDQRPEGLFIDMYTTLQKAWDISNTIGRHLRNISNDIRTLDMGMYGQARQEKQQNVQQLLEESGKKIDELEQIIDQLERYSEKFPPLLEQSKLTLQEQDMLQCVYDASTQLYDLEKRFQAMIDKIGGPSVTQYLRKNFGGSVPSMRGKINNTWEAIRNQFEDMKNLTSGISDNRRNELREEMQHRASEIETRIQNIRAALDAVENKIEHVKQVQEQMHALYHSLDTLARRM